MTERNKPSRRPLSSSRGATRTRAYRKRLRHGLRFIPVPLHAIDLDCLVAKRMLAEEDRHDSKALQAALTDIIDKFLAE